MTNWYATREALKARLGLTGTTEEDAIFDSILDAVSRGIEDKTGHYFYVQDGAEYVTPTRAERILTSDLIAVTTLKTDTSGDLSYATTWTGTDYLLYPRNAVARHKPYWDVRRAPGRSYSFAPGTEVEITGRWGYYEVLARSTATVAGAHNDSTTTLAVSAGVAFAIGQTLKVGSEQLFVSDISDDDLMVTRHENGTTAATILDGAVIDVYTYPTISEACLLQAAHLYQSSKAVGGVIGGGEFGAIRIAALQPGARVLLQPLTHKRLY